MTLTLKSDQTHVLLGSSGSGKTTLLRMLTGSVTPDSGEILLDELRVCSKNRNEIQSKLGYVIQEGGLFPHLTAKQNVELPAKIHRFTQIETENRISKLRDLVGLDENQIRRFPSELSGGQKQRIGLMRALVLNPPYLLLDEPLSALDPLVRAELQGELKNIFNRLKKTVIIVTHDINEAAFFGHTISLLDKGRLLQHGTFEEFFETPNTLFVEKFFRAQKPNEKYRKYL